MRARNYAYTTDDKQKAYYSPFAISVFGFFKSQCVKLCEGGTHSITDDDIHRLGFHLNCLLLLSFH